MTFSDDNEQINARGGDPFRRSKCSDEPPWRPVSNRAALPER